MDYYNHNPTSGYAKISSWSYPLVGLFYISPQQDLYSPQKMTKLFPKSPGNYYNHNPTSGYDQELIIITIIDQNRPQIN